MAIIQIELRNFKSFIDLNIKLKKFNVLIGANASGKSNFIQAFQFLKDVTDFGLDNAISMQGGFEYLRTISADASDELSIAITSNLEYGFFSVASKKKLIGMKFYETRYVFALAPKGKTSQYKITKDKLVQKCTFVHLEKINSRLNEKEELGKGVLTLSQKDGKVSYSLEKPPGVPIKESDIFPPFLFDRSLSQNSLLIESQFRYITDVDEVLADMAMYDFDPKLPKKATPITGKAELEQDGGNLSIVLKEIISKKESKRKLINLVKDILPFIEDINIQKFADKSLLPRLKESYNFNRYLPSSIVSDGTICIIEIILALFFGRRSLIIIEEPERNIHPHLISKVAEYMADASKSKQIIVTTHNPEFIKHVDLENILLVARDKKGSSTVCRPEENEKVKIFLQNEMGIDELYVENLLEI